MYRFIISLCFLLLTASGYAQITEDGMEFEVYNKQNQTMVGLYMDFAHDVKPDWGENVLAASIEKRLEPGEGVVVTIKGHQEFCLYDILAVWEDGTEEQASEVDVCDLDSWTFK